MKMERMLPLFLGLFFLVGCTSNFVASPLPSIHPANPQAPISPFSPPLNPFQGGPLSFSIHSTGQTEPGMSIPSHGAPGTQMMSQAQTVEGTGKVIAVVPGSQQIILEHGEIKGFMGAMTMGYKVKSTSLLEGLKAGDTVRFTIDTGENTIIQIVKEKE